MSHLTVRFNTFIESILRVPPIFVLDEIFKSGFSFPFSLWSSEMDLSMKNYTSPAMKVGSGDQFLYTTLFLTTLKFLLSFIGESIDYFEQIIKTFILMTCFLYF